MEIEFALNINNKDQDLSPRKGLNGKDLGKLITNLDKAVREDKYQKFTLFKIENHGYTPHFLTNDEKVYNSFVDVHRHLQEREMDELSKAERGYAKALRDVLGDSLYVEALDRNNDPIERIYAKEIGKSVKSYYVVTNQSGMISEIGSPSLKSRCHIYLDGVAYKIFIQNNQDKELKEFYRNGLLDLKVKQKRSVKTGQIISAELIKYKVRSNSLLHETTSSLTKEDLSFLNNINTTDDIIGLLRK